MRPRLLVLCALAATTLSAAAPPARSQQGDAFMYCELRDAVHSVAYFSTVFRALPEPSVPYADRFHDFVFRAYNKVYGTAKCVSFENSYKAEDAKDRTRFRYRGLFNKFIETGWRG